MADTETTQTAGTQASTEASPAEAAPAQTEAPKTGDQAIQEGKGRPPGKPISARDFNRAMGAGSSQTSALIGDAAQETAPQRPEQAQEAVAEPGQGEGTPPEGEARTKPNRSGEQQPIDEHGRYQGKEGQQEQEAPVAEAEVEAEAGVEGEAAEEGALTEPEATPEAGEEGSQPETAEPVAADDAVPEGMVRIEIPEEFQRNFGTHQDVPEGQEDFFRWNINNRIRNSEVERLQKEAERAEKLEQENQELRNKTLQAEVTSEAAQKFKETEDYEQFVTRYQKYKRAEEEGSLEEGSASEYWQDAVEPAFRAFEANLLQSRNQEIVAERQGQAAQQWVGQMWQQANALPDAITNLDGFEDEFRASIDAFNYEAERGRFDSLKDSPNPDQELGKAFNKYFSSRLLSTNPKVAEAIKKAAAAQDQTRRDETEKAQKAREAREKARVEREAEKARRQEKEEAARNAATNPMGNVPSGQVHRHAEGAQPDMNARQFDKLMTRRG